MSSDAKSPKSIDAFKRVFAVLLLPIVLPICLVGLYWRLLFRPVIYLLVWGLWWPRGVFVLFVYPNVEPYSDRFRSVILPVIRDSAEVLAWPDFEPRHWRRSIAVAAYRQFVGGTFVPMAVVFRPFRRAKRFSFSPLWEEVRRGKAGAWEALEAMERDFFNCIEETKTQRRGKL